MGIGTLRRYPPYTLPKPVEQPAPETPEPSVPTMNDVPVTEEMQEEIEARLTKDKKVIKRFRP